MIWAKQVSVLATIWDIEGIADSELTTYPNTLDLTTNTCPNITGPASFLTFVLTQRFPSLLTLDAVHRIRWGRPVVVRLRNRGKRPPVGVEALMDELELDGRVQVRLQLGVLLGRLDGFFVRYILRRGVEVMNGLDRLGTQT